MSISPLILITVFALFLNVTFCNKAQGTLYTLISHLPYYCYHFVQAIMPCTSLYSSPTLCPGTTTENLPVISAFPLPIIVDRITRRHINYIPNAPFPLTEGDYWSETPILHSYRRIKKLKNLDFFYISKRISLPSEILFNRPYYFEKKRDIPFFF